MKGRYNMSAQANKKIPTMEVAENKAVQKLIKAGYKDPRKDEGHLRSLVFTSFDGRKYRKFITSFLYLDPSQVKKSQVRDKDYDPIYCQAQLKPLIEKEGLHYVCHINSQKTLETGHNRYPVLMEIYPGEKLPFLEISKPYLENDDGTYTLCKDNQFEDEIAKIGSNSAPPNNPYTMECIGQQIRRLYNIDPTFRGLNPTGDWFEENEGPFDNIMNELHPKQFLSKGTRTKIREKAGKGKSIIKPVEFADWTHAATSRGWPSGVKPGNKKPSRMSFNEWFDPADNTNITTVSTNGNKLKEKVLLELTEKHLDTAMGTTKGIKLLMKVNSPSTNPIALEKERRDFVSSKIDVLNTRLRKNNWAQIKEVYWVKQLNHNSDKGMHFVQDKNGIMKEKK